MKINANENVLSMNKKVRKMGTEPTTTPETTVSNPENTMKAMNVMGKQNIAFQGGMATVVEEGAKKVGKKMAKGAIAAAVTALIAASCTKETNISVVANYDMEAIAAVMQSYAEQISALTVIISNMRTENAAANATQIELLRQMITIQQQQLDKLNQMSDEDKAFYSKTEQFYKDIINNMVTQEMFLNYLGEDSPMFKAIMAVIEKMNNGQLSAQDAYNQIIKLLTNIDANVEAILKEAKSFNSKMEKSLENQEKYYQEYKAFCEKCYEAILAGNMTLEEFKDQSIKKYGEIIGSIVNNSALISALAQLVDNGFSTSEQNQNRLINIGQNLNELQAATLEQSIKIGNDIMAIYEKMLENGEINQSRYNEMKNFLNNWYDAYSENSANTAQYEGQVLTNLSELIKTVANGDASILAELNKINNSNMSTNEKLDAMNEILENIDVNVESIMKTINELVKTFNKFFSEYKNNTAEIKQLVKDVRNGVKDVSVNVANINKKIGSSLSGVEAQLKNIAALIVKADAHNVAALTEGKEEIISVLETLGYSQTEILQMTMEEVKAAIEKNGTYIQNSGAVLSKILSYVSVLPELKDQGKITNTKLDLIYNKLNNIKIDVEISPEVLAELEALLDQYFDEIADLLNDINNNITTQGDRIIAKMKESDVNLNDLKTDVKEIKNNSNIQIAYDQYILDAIKNVDAGVTNIEEIAAQIGVDVSWIREHGGGSGSTVDLSKIEKFLEQEVANTKATNYVVNLMYAEWSNDLDAIKELLAGIKGSNADVLNVLNSIDNKNSLIIAAINSLADQEKISDKTRDEWLEKIYNKKCNCAKDVTIIVEKIYKYLVDGNEGIVDYDKLFDDLFGDEGTNAVAMATTPKTNSVDINRLIMTDNSMRFANTINKATTGRPLSNGVYTMGNIAYTVSGDLDKTMSVADFYKLAAEKMNQA